MESIDYSIKDLDKVIKVDGKVKNTEISRLTAPGENFLSLVLRVDIEVEKDGYSKIVNSVAKCLKEGPQKEGVNFNAINMKNEIKWYSEIIPLMQEFGEQNGITLTYFPEYLGSRYSLDPSKTEPDSDTVLLIDNLIPKGYTNYDRYVGSDFNTSKAILKQLAIFHAIPIAIKNKKPELFKVIKDYLESCHLQRFEHGPPSADKPKRGPPGGRKIEETFLEELSNKPEFGPYMSHLKPVFDKPLVGKVLFPNMAEEPWNTITHNDFWVNNFMVNLTEGKEPLVKIVDFQTCLYGSFTRDLVFFLLTSVNNDVTKTHLDDFLRFYYEEFTSVLRKCKVDLELSYAEYLEEVRKSAVESEIGHAIFFSAVIGGKKGETLDGSKKVDPFTHIIITTKNMNQIQKEKLLLIASEAIRKNWI